MLAVAFTGESNSGKTTLIEKLVRLIKSQNPKAKICVIKHDPKDKAQIDNNLKKDSAKFFHAGADVAILGTNSTTLRFQNALNLESVIYKFGECDYLFVEGLKELELPRICVARDSFNERFLPHICAIALDSSIKIESLEKYNLPLLDLNNEAKILEWILQNIKEYK